MYVPDFKLLILYFFIFSTCSAQRWSWGSFANMETLLRNSIKQGNCASGRCVPQTECMDPSDDAPGCLNGTDKTLVCCMNLKSEITTPPPSPAESSASAHTEHPQEKNLTVTDDPEGNNVSPDAPHAEEFRYYPRNPNWKRTYLSRRRHDHTVGSDKRIIFPDEAEARRANKYPREFYDGETYGDYDGNPWYPNVESPIHGRIDPRLGFPVDADEAAAQDEKKYLKDVPNQRFTPGDYDYNWRDHKPRGNGGGQTFNEKTSAKPSRPKQTQPTRKYGYGHERKTTKPSTTAANSNPRKTTKVTWKESGNHNPNYDTSASRTSQPGIGTNKPLPTKRNVIARSSKPTSRSTTLADKNHFTSSTVAYPRWHSGKSDPPSTKYKNTITEKPRTVKTTASTTKSSATGRFPTKKSSYTTALPSVNYQLCGVRESNDVTSRRGRSGIQSNTPDAAAVFPGSEGKRSSFQRIVGGEESDPYSWPWVAALYKVSSRGGDRFLSAGTLINERFILTAAHVFKNEDLRSSSFEVMLGVHEVNETNPRFRVEHVLRHPSFQQRFYYHDIALVKLDRVVRFSSYVTPVCLPPLPAPEETDSDLRGTRVTVMGWGDESFGGVTSRVLKEASFPIVSRKSCNASYIQVASSRFPYGITSNMICAGSPNGGKDACQGDSGGPLTTVQSGKYVQVGIVSFGYKCGDKDFPGVYTKVASYMHWIADNSRCDEDYNPSYYG